MRVSGNVSVERGHAFRRVNHKQRNVGVFQMLAGHDDGKFFRHQLGLSLAADSRSINEAEALAVALDDLVDGIARSSSNRRNDRAIRTGQLIEQSRLANVRTSDDRNFDFGGSHRRRRGPTALIRQRLFQIRVRKLQFFLRGLLPLPGLGLFLHRRNFENRFQQLPDPNAVLCGNGINIANPQRAEILRQMLLLLRVNLVDGQEQRLPGAMQKTCQFHIRTSQFAAPVHHHNDGRRFLQRKPRLSEDFRRDEVVIVGNDPAGINQTKEITVPLRLRIQSVARNPGLVAHDRAPPACNSVEKRRLAHVRPSHNAKHGQGRGCVRFRSRRTSQS